MCEPGGAASRFLVAVRLRSVTANSDGPLRLLSCPQCSQVATIEWSRIIDGTVHIKLYCVARHWFLMPAEQVTCYPTTLSVPQPSP